MALTTAQKNELANRLVGAQQSGNYGSFNDLVKQLRLTQKDLLDNFPAINQAGINEQISRGAVVPTTAPAATNYTQSQLATAIRDSLAAGYTVQQARMGAMNNFGVSETAFNAALDQVQGSPSAFSDARVAQAIRDSLAQGFTLEQARQGALNNYGVGQSQFDRAMQLVDRSSMQFRGSAPTYQFPGLLTDRREMPTGAQRFISSTPGSLLYDVPRVENAEVAFQPGAFDYEEIKSRLTAPAGTTINIEGLDWQTSWGAPPGSKTSTNATEMTGSSTSGTKTTTPASTTTTTTMPPPKTSSQFSDAQVAQAIRESMGQGFSLLDSMAGAARVYGIPIEQVTRAADVVALERSKPKSSASMGLLSDSSMNQMSSAPFVQSSPVVDTGLLSSQNSGFQDFGASQAETQFAAPDGFQDNQVAQAVIEALGQGYNLGDIQMGAFNNFGVDENQFNRAVAMLPSMGYTIGQGFQ
jgi:hypothetical protein